MDSDAVERARRRLEALRSESDGADLAATVERAREQLESFAQATAELEATLPERVSTALHDSMRAEVVPVARQLGETSIAFLVDPSWTTEETTAAASTTRSILVAAARQLEAA